MNYLFITSNSFDNYGNSITASEIYKKRIQENKWAIYNNTRNRRNIKPDDRILFFVSNSVNGGAIVGSGIVDKIFNARKNQYDENEQGTVNYFISFRDINQFEGIVFRAILPNLSFAPKNLSKWGVVVMGGVRKISDLDYEYIIRNKN